MSPGCLDILITHLGNTLLTETELQPLVKKMDKAFLNLQPKALKNITLHFLSLLVPGITKWKCLSRQYGRQELKTFTSLSAPPLVS